MLNWEQQKQMIADAADALEKELGTVFCNPAFPGEFFRINRTNSFVSDVYGIQLYLDIKKGSEWLAFAKGTPREVRQNSRSIESRLEKLREEMEQSRCTECRLSGGQHLEGCSNIRY